MRGLWLRRLAVFVAGGTGLLAYVAQHAPAIMHQQHCEPFVREPFVREPVIREPVNREPVIRR
jgi:hypothetical protein